MKIAVIGLGSMGRRRAGLLLEAGMHRLAGVDPSPERQAQAKDAAPMETYRDIPALLSSGFSPEAAFICVPPVLHGETAVQMLNAGCHVFSEINLLSDGYAEIRRLSKEVGKIYFLSSTFNYRKDIRYIQDTVQHMEGCAAYTYHVGQYLPDWHPWESYKDFFVAEKRTNGVRELMGIDIPWMYKAFGEIADISATGGNISGLPLEYPDYYLVTFTHTKGHKGMVCFDVAARVATRRLEVMGDNLHLLWKGKPNGLYAYSSEKNLFESVETYQEAVSHKQGYHPMIVENAYMEEIRCFFDTIAGKTCPRYTLKDDERVIRWMDEIEGSVRP